MKVNGKQDITSTLIKKKKHYKGGTTKLPLNCLTHTLRAFYAHALCTDLYQNENVHINGCVCVYM